MCNNFENICQILVTICKYNSPERKLSTPIFSTLISEQKNNFWTVLRILIPIRGFSKISSTYILYIVVEMANSVASEQRQHSAIDTGTPVSLANTDAHSDQDLHLQQHPYPHADSHNSEKISGGSSSTAGQEKEVENPHQD